MLLAKIVGCETSSHALLYTSNKLKPHLMLVRFVICLDADVREETVKTIHQQVCNSQDCLPVLLKELYSY